MDGGATGIRIKDKSSMIPKTRSWKSPFTLARNLRTAAACAGISIILGLGTWAWSGRVHDGLAVAGVGIAFSLSEMWRGTEKGRGRNDGNEH